MFIALRIFRGFAGLIFGLQVLGLLRAVTWLIQPGDVTESMMVFLIFKLGALILSGIVFFGLRTIINRLHIKKYNKPHPVFETNKWTL